ncbi:MAG: FAD-dependent oxidoreductase, partial [Jatrophihabitantaceae bacterium]
SKKVGDRVVVLGGSVTGLFAASALAEAYREVVIVDRDELIGVTEARRGAPQARHINGLLVQGARVMEELFPDITAEMVADGCPLTDLSGTVLWYFNGKPLKQVRAGLTNVAARRPLLEAHLRRRVEALANVRFMQRYDILGLVATPDNATVTGVRVQPNDSEGPEEVLTADLVVDASGRGSRTPLWLEAMGYGRVEEEGTKIGLGYTSRHYRLRTDNFGTNHSIIAVANPVLPRGAIFTKTDDNTVELTTYGIMGDHPPTDPEGFNSFVKTLAAPQIYEHIVDAEPLDDPVLYKYPTTLRRRYERMSRLPDGLLIMGDAVCTPNPIFAQAQTLAALEVLSLRDTLRSGQVPKPKEFMKEVARVVDLAWEMTEGVNLTFPGVEGKRSLKLKFMLGYMYRLQVAATRDASITEAFMRSAGLVDPPEALMKPSLIRRVLKGYRAAQPVS